MKIVKLAETESDILKCWDALHALRPHLEPSAFVPLIQSMQSEGYQLAFIEVAGRAAAACGYRYLHMLHMGKHIYIDDLTTLPEYRGEGYAGALLDFVEAQARAAGYNAVTLDSGHHRFDAHRLYLNKKFNIASHHFVKKL